MELNYLQRYERNYFVKPSKTRFRKTRFCIQEVEKRDLLIMHFSKKSAPYVEDLHLFGEIGICYIPSLGYNRTSNKGRIGLYLNLPINHPRHTFKFFNPYTKKVFTSRNVTWTGLTWGEYENISLDNYFIKRS